ncbi:MAG TPA: alpha-L-rhamnosidase C-terminal domain-containing protein, partial [Chitinophagaceae bacterium]|nr:alpha-L-rhamnosidase C-terminal domain-containing protein [Chitinophagaceae bacterium]
DDVPGYGYQLKHGATALTESWQAYPSVSNNHFMLGHLMEWFYQGLAGIQQTANSVGFKEILIKPTPVGDISHARATFRSPYGSIISDWEKSGTNFSLKLEIPVNSSAVIYLPASSSSVIKEGRRLMMNGKYENGKAIFRLGSGSYQFTVEE